jgi:hypothetical protein
MTESETTEIILYNVHELLQISLSKNAFIDSSAELSNFYFCL